MSSKEVSIAMKNYSRRKFLRTVGAGVPTLALVAQETTVRGAAPLAEGPEVNSGKFTPIDLSPFFNASPADFGQRELAKDLSGDSARDGLVRTPTGDQKFRGIPFWLGPQGVGAKTWVGLSTRASSWTARTLEIPLQQKAAYLCLAQFCDWDQNETPSHGGDVVERVGQRLANVTLLYEGGEEHVLPIRRRFEVNSPSTHWGHLSFTSQPHLADTPLKLTDPLRVATEWGGLQTVVRDNHYPGGNDGRPLAVVWVCALANPQPERTLKAVRFEATAEDPLVLCGLTLFHGRENPLRYERLRVYRITLPEAAAEANRRWTIDVDLGVVARTYTLSNFEPQVWLSAPNAGLGEAANPTEAAPHLYAEVAASSDATLALLDNKTGNRYEFDLHQATPGKELEGRPGGTRIEILEHDRVWIHAQVVDATTRRPTPARLAFRSKEGRYIPPYGHRTEINDEWFQDYGADLKLMDTSFAYVDGAFQVELPVGEVYLELRKGFEYAPIRRKLKIEAGQRNLNLEISQFTDMRTQGWVTADTHVHFLAPSTAVMEGQAEGVNLINLLAAQWGDLFTNVGDFFQGPLTSSDGQTIVHLGTENRQHILGHLGLLGGHGAPVYPMSADGPGEGYLGSPLWTTLSDWADECRKREGLVVAVHFPYPTGEIAADIVRGKIDAVEVYSLGIIEGTEPHLRGEAFDNLRFLDWYKYLNCGYRLPVVGGTDKMGAYMPVGAIRTYAHLGQEEFNFPNWAKAVRAGNTFTTTGPLLLFHAEGKAPGEEITLGQSGGTVEVVAEANSFVPFHRLEVVLNGQVVAAREESAGTRTMVFKEKVQVPGSGWLAARCASRLGPATNGIVRIAAHTSPVYLRAAGQELFSASAAAYMLTLIDGAQEWVETLATRPDQLRWARIRAVLDDARRQLQRRMHEHGVQQ
jgi:hypothetical protein